MGLIPLFGCAVTKGTNPPPMRKCSVFSSFPCSRNTYVAVKVLTRTSAHAEPALSRELGVYEHLSRLNPSHVGSAYIRGLYDTFELSNPCGVYQCLVHPPMHMSINKLRMRARSCRLSEPLLKQTLICLLQALDFLHSEANIVHSGKILRCWWFLCIC